MSILAFRPFKLSITMLSPTPLDRFEALYRAEVSAITAFFARRSPDPETVADLTADTFVEVIGSFHTYDPARGPERQWVYGIARRIYAKHLERANRQSDALARHGAREMLDQDDLHELAARIDAEAPGRALLVSLADMSSVEREAIELVDLDGLTPTEAAAALDIAPNIFRVRLFRARARLRKESSHVQI